MDEQQVEEYVAPVNEEINSDPNTAQQEQLMAQDQHDEPDIEAVEEVQY